MSEAFNLSDQVNGGVLPQSRESLAMKGFYEVTCLEPVESHREAYLKAFAKTQQIEQFGFVRRLLNRRAGKRARALMAATPKQERWRAEIRNIVPTVGANLTLDTILAGSSYTAAWYMFLVSATGYTSAPVLGDTMASHSGWTEDTNYAASARPTAAFAAASGGTKSLSAPLAFTMNASTTIKGCGLASSSVKGGTSGTLLSAGLFTGGDQPVTSGNILSVSYQATM